MVVLAATPGEIPAAELLRAAVPHALEARPKAGSIAALELSRTLPAGPRAVATVSITVEESPFLNFDDERPAKRARTDETRVRCRQILIKYAGCKNAKDVQRKPVTRSLDAAMEVALQTLRQLETESFTVLCRQFSECP